MKTLLKNAREVKGFKTREVAELSGIDQALISKFENGSRTPTKLQVKKLSDILDIDFELLTVLWLKEKILTALHDEPLGLKALKAAESEISRVNIPAGFPDQFQKLLDEMNSLKSLISEKKP